MAATKTRGAGYGDVLMPVFPGIPCTVEIITLDGAPTLRVTQNGRGIGYFPDVETATRHGVDFPTAIIKE